MMGASLDLALSNSLRLLATVMAALLFLDFMVVTFAGMARIQKVDRVLRFIGLLGQWLLALVLCAAVVLRGVEVGHEPWQSWYEVLLLCAGFSVVCILFLRYMLRDFRVTPLQVTIFDFFTAAAAAITFLLLYIAAGKDNSASFLPPALKSAWFAPHVVAYILAYALFLIVCGGVVVWWILAAWSRFLTKKPSPELQQWLKDFDRFSYRIVVIAFPVLTLALILGALWGQDAWGTYWGWDCKEVCALISWLIYVLYLHLRYLSAWLGWPLYLLLFLGGVSIIVCFLLVNYLPASFSSMHKYV